MVDLILQQAGYTKNTSYKETRFVKTPTADPYITYDDSYEIGGADLKPFWKEHSITLNLYSKTPNSVAEKTLEAVMDGFADRMMGEGWERLERVWEDGSNVFNTQYNFQYIEKIKYNKEG